MYTIGLNKMDLANVGSGLGLKEAAETRVEGVLNGFGSMLAERVDNETGESKQETVSIVKVDGIVYSGASKVVDGRLNNLKAIVGESTDVQDGKISVRFENVKLAKGTGANLIITRYDE